MKKVTDLKVVRHERAASQEDAWARFVSATMTAKTTLRLEDGIAAGKAYREFVESFVRPQNGRR